MNIPDIIYKIFPFIKLYKKNKILTRKYKLLIDKELSLDLKKINEKEYLKELEDYEKNESERQKIIESKAKSTLFIITLVLTLLLSSVTFIYQFNQQFNNSLIIILIFGIIYFIFSAITIINVLKPEEYNNLYFDGKYNIPTELFNLKNLEESEKIYYQPAEIQDKEQILALSKSIKLNEYTISKKSNSLDCTYELIERGIILVAIFSILLLIGFVLNIIY